jgi:hypothetical protein
VQPWSVWSEDLGSSACCWDFRDEKCNSTIVLRPKVLAELYTDVKQMTDMVLVLFFDQSCACRQSNCREHDLQCNSGELNLLPVLWYAHQLPEVDNAVDECDWDFLSHPLFSAFLADAYLGHYYTLTIFSTIYLPVNLLFHTCNSFHNNFWYNSLYAMWKKLSVIPVRNPC